jgi:hypothetical protein
MNTNETNGTKNSGAEGVSRRQFVERLRRAAIFVAPVAVTLALKTPKAMGSVFNPPPSED